MTNINAKIIGPVSGPGNLTVSGWVSHMLEDPKPGDLFWFAVDPSSQSAIGGLQLRTAGGGATAHEITGDTVGVKDLSVDPQYQRHGIGQHLMEAAESWAAGQSNLPQTLGLGVETDNQRAINLYRKLGYAIAAKQGNDVTFIGPDGKPCYVMYKRLTKPQRLYFKTYLAMIENSPGTNMFRSFYLRQPDGREFDAIGDGENACAFFVSSVLKLFDKVQWIHGTVGSTIRDLEESGWTQVSEPRPGDVISWEPHTSPDGQHGHIGFYVGDKLAVSTSSSRKTVARHDLHFGQEQRKVIGAYHYPKWDQ
jgi:ribosomal protein S18 acetylase RimI-like enzyme